MRMLTAGESHGQAVLAIVDDVPAGLPLSADDIDRDLARRQSGYGRGGRMLIESDRASIISGVRNGETMGSPVSFMIENLDHVNWADSMAVEKLTDPESVSETRPRPGHGDLAGLLKFGASDARDILERASARETVARVAVGAVARRMLAELGITVHSRVIQVGEARAPDTSASLEDYDRADEDPMRCSDTEASKLMVAQVDRAAADGDSVGGVFEVAAFGVVPGLGSHAQADRRLDSRLCAGLASIPAIKAVAVGDGFELAGASGSQAHDEIFYEEGRGTYRKTNRAGGIEAGITNGEPVILRAAMKPIPTLASPLATVDVRTLEPAQAFKERADVCAVPAASVVGEAVVAFTLACAAQQKLGSDSIEEMKRNLEGYLERVSRLWRRH
jgi:chorismate synthase